MNRSVLAAAMTACSLVTAGAMETDRQADDEAAIRQAVKSYVAAFNEGDAEALAAMWSLDAVYENPFSGDQVVGREAIEQQFVGIFAEQEGVKLQATTDAIQFVSPGVAVEHGTATVIHADQEPAESAYTAIYVKRDGQWLLDRVTEEDVPVVRSNYEHLQDLQWMIGTWVDQDEQARVETTCQWTKNRNFMTRTFTLAVRDRTEIAGMQIQNS